MKNPDLAKLIEELKIETEKLVSQSGSLTLPEAYWRGATNILRLTLENVLKETAKNEPPKTREWWASLDNESKGYIFPGKDSAKLIPQGVSQSEREMVRVREVIE